MPYAVGDRRPAVARNRRLVAAAVRADPRRPVEAQQVHGAAAEVVGRKDAGRTIPGVDVLLTPSPNIWLAVHTADCVRVLIIGTRCQPDLYFSYRRERATGRMAACIRQCDGAQRE